jgi:hypothetical protein
MLKSRLTRLWSRVVPITAASVVVWVVTPAPSAWAAPASQTGGLTDPAPVNANMFRLPIVALAIVTGLLALVSVRRVVRGS